MQSCRQLWYCSSMVNKPSPHAVEAAFRLAAAHIAKHPEACVLDLFVGSPSLGSLLSLEQLADLRPLCSWECDCGCPYGG
jgi:hypothetical protein